MLWINQEKRRCYRVRVYQDLLGDWVMVRSWGSLDTLRGGSKTDLVDCSDVEGLLLGIEKQRVKKGYSLVNE